MDARVVAGGIKIAGIEQSDLEYDPALYQRDRGELDWDTRSVSSANVLADTKSVYSGRSSPAPSKALDYNRYLAKGPQTLTDSIEMTRFDGDELPLLDSQQTQGFYDPTASKSTASLPAYAVTEPMMREREMPPIPAVTPAYGSREAPIHRPSPSPQPPYSSPSPQPYASPYRTYQQQYPPIHSREPSAPLYAPSPSHSRSPSPAPTPTTAPGSAAPIYEQNMAGRGGFRRYGPS